MFVWRLLLYVRRFISKGMDMESSSKNLILDCANKPNKILFLQGDEIMGLFFPLLLFAVMKHFTLGVIVGVGLCCMCKWLKKKFGASALTRVVYWYFPTPRKRFRIYIPSHIREYIG